MSATPRLRYMALLLDLEEICDACEDDGGYATIDEVLSKHEMRAADDELAIVEVELE